MKLSSSSSTSKKPISSPGRAVAESKFPPPLMRFLLRSSNNVSSRRTRTRPRPKSNRRTTTTPLFFRKKKSTNPGETQEPTSPKVTCIGQVRARRSKKPNSTNKTHQSHNQNSCNHCVHLCSCNCNCCCVKKKVFRPVCKFWVRLFCCGSKSGRVIEEQEQDREEQEYEEEQEERGSEVIMASGTTPPKNALLLTRCRSAPYRSSSLACRLWETEETAKPEESETEMPHALGSEPVATREFEGNNEGSLGNRDSIESSNSVLLLEAPPLLVELKRCRSEPAWRGNDKLDPLTARFWKERRVDDDEGNNIVHNSESCTPQSLS